MKTNILLVAETFYSLQGEGRNIGMPSVFLRLGGCNLLCQSACWRCDTIEVWQKSKATEFENVLDAYMVQRLRDGAHLIITGGEPLLHQNAIQNYLEWFEHQYKFMPFIEVETNGTILPDWYLLSIVKYWNVSPKLSNSGEPYEKRVNENALTLLNSYAQTIFKFVIHSEGDVLEMINDYGFLFTKKFWLMPAGGTQEELDKVRQMVAEKAIFLGMNYSERLHIVIWNKKTGV